MNFYLASYIDFIQSIGFISIFTFSIFALSKIYLSMQNENQIKDVKIRVDK